MNDYPCKPSLGSTERSQPITTFKELSPVVSSYVVTTIHKLSSILGANRDVCVYNSVEGASISEQTQKNSCLMPTSVSPPFSALVIAGIAIDKGKNKIVILPENDRDKGHDPTRGKCFYKKSVGIMKGRTTFIISHKLSGNTPTCRDQSPMLINFRSTDISIPCLSRVPILSKFLIEHYLISEIDYFLLDSHSGFFLLFECISLYHSSLFTTPFLFTYSIPNINIFF